MQLVGATSWFIKKPYLLKSLLMGLISVVVSSLLLFAVVAAGDRQLPELAALRDQMLTVYIGIGLLALGLIISFLSTGLLSTVIFVTKLTSYINTNHLILDVSR